MKNIWIDSLTNVDDMLECGEAPFNTQGNPLQRDDVGKDGIPDDVSPHQPTPFVL